MTGTEEYYLITDNEMRLLMTISNKKAMREARRKAWYDAHDRKFCPHWISSTNPKSNLCNLGISRFYCNKSVTEHDARISAVDLEQIMKLFGRVKSLCNAIIEKQDSQSLWGFNALIIIKEIESLRQNGLVKYDELSIF